MAFIRPFYGHYTAIIRPSYSSLEKLLYHFRAKWLLYGVIYFGRYLSRAILSHHVINSLAFSVISFNIPELICVVLIGLSGSILLFISRSLRRLLSHSFIAHSIYNSTTTVSLNATTYYIL